MIARIVVALLLLAFTCFYRFNTMGGGLGGFDNDHFVSFAYAKQMQAGARPLRDFDDLALQGAWPPLAYQVSVLGQQWLGDNLRSEALVTIGAVGVATALTFVAASLLSPVLWAALATLVGVFVAPTLYNYPKVLVLAAVALVVVLYARHPTTLRVIVAAGLTAAAFLFRHDLAVYAGVGLFAVLVGTNDRRRAFRHTATYLVLTVTLLAPSLLYVQRYQGLSTYVRDALELSQRERVRTGLSAWPSFTWVAGTGEAVAPATFFGVEENAVAWLYYLTRLLPLIVLFAAWRWAPATPRHFGQQRAALAIAVMSAFAALFLIRGNVAVRLGDFGPLLAVPLAYVTSAAVRHYPKRSAWMRVARVSLVIAVLGCTALSTITVGVVRRQLWTAGLTESRVMERFHQVWTELGGLPQTVWSDSGAQGSYGVSAYLNRCTAPSDRVVLLAFAPEVLPFAGRLFGAGRLSVIPGFGLDRRRQSDLVARWKRESVPIVLVEFEEFLDPANPVAPLVRDYLATRYRDAGSIDMDSERALRVFVERDAALASDADHRGLPCRRPA